MKETVKKIRKYVCKIQLWNVAIHLTNDIDSDLWRCLLSNGMLRFCIWYLHHDQICILRHGYGVGTKSWVSKVFAWNIGKEILRCKTEASMRRDSTRRVKIWFQSRKWRSVRAPFWRWKYRECFGYPKQREQENCVGAELIRRTSLNFLISRTKCTTLIRIRLLCQYTMASLGCIMFKFYTLGLPVAYDRTIVYVPRVYNTRV